MAEATKVEDGETGKDETSEMRNNIETIAYSQNSRFKAESHIDRFTCL